MSSHDKIYPVYGHKHQDFSSIDRGYQHFTILLDHLKSIHLLWKIFEKVATAGV